MEPQHYKINVEWSPGSVSPGRTFIDQNATGRQPVSVYEDLDVNTFKTVFIERMKGYSGLVIPGGGQYEDGMRVGLTAHPVAGWSVKRWQGTDDDSWVGGSNTVTMDTSKTVVVELAPTPSETGNTGGTGGTGNDEQSGETTPEVIAPSSLCPVASTALFALTLLGLIRSRGSRGR